MEYIKRMTDANGGYIIQQEYINDDGSFRYSQAMNEDKPDYLRWLALGNVCKVIEYIAPPEISDDDKWKAIRAIRTQYISGCDWTQLADSPLNEAENYKYKVYRQALRDITNPKGVAGKPLSDPDSIVYPTI